MSFVNAPLQLLQKQPQNPISSALGGFQAGAQMMPGIKKAQFAPKLQQLQALAALAKIRQAGQVKPTAISKAFSEFQQSSSQDTSGMPSVKTQVLAANLRKLMASSKGTSITTTPGTQDTPGSTTVQIGGSQPQDVDALHPSHAEQNRLTPVSQQTAQQGLLFPQQASQAQAADQKQLGVDMKHASLFSQQSSDKDLKFFGDLKRAAKDASGFINPITGHFIWSSPAGTRLQQLLAKNTVRIMGMTKGLRTQKEFDKIVQGAGTAKMFPSTLMKTFNDGLDEAYQRRLKNDFYSNYAKQGGKSSSEAAKMWASSLTPSGISTVPDKFLNFNVSGTNRNYRDFVGIARRGVTRFPKNKRMLTLPIVSLIRKSLED